MTCFTCIDVNQLWLHACNSNLFILGIRVLSSLVVIDPFSTIFLQDINHVHYESSNRTERCQISSNPAPCYFFARKFIRRAGIRLLNAGLAGSYGIHALWKQPHLKGWPHLPGKEKVTRYITAVLWSSHCSFVQFFFLCNQDNFIECIENYSWKFTIEMTQMANNKSRGQSL